MYDRQISDLVHGFIQIWNKFDSTLSKELTQIRDRLQGMQPQGEVHASANYELLYRAGNHMYPDRSITMGELSNALSVPLSTATRIADWLVDRGYIERLPDPDDRRIVRVALTYTGRGLYEAIEKYVRERLQQILSTLTDEERGTLLTLMGKVVAGL